MERYKPIKWDEAEKLAPECSAAWDLEMRNVDAQDSVGEYEIIYDEESKVLAVFEIDCRERQATGRPCCCRQWTDGRWVRPKKPTDGK